MGNTFAEFVTARSSRLLRVAYLLTRDWALAEDLLQTSLAKTWSAWPRINGDPEPYVRRILVNTYSTWWRRRWNFERPVALAQGDREAIPAGCASFTVDLRDRHEDDPYREIDERDRVQRALSRLPRRQRAVLVLRYYEDLSEAEIAETLGISPGTVKSHAAKGLANLRLDPSLATAGLRLESEEPAGAARLAAVTARVQQRRRQKVTAIVAAAAVVLALLIGYAISPAHRSAPHPATTPSPSTNGFAARHAGTQLVTTGSVSAAHPRTHLEWPLTARNVHIFARCQTATPGLRFRLPLSAGGQPFGAIRCTGVPAGQIVSGTDFLLEMTGDVPGLLTKGMMDVEIEHARASVSDSTEVPVPADFVAYLAIGDTMPFDASPFPAPPIRYPDFSAGGLDQRPGARHVSYSRGAAAIPGRLVFPWGDWDLHASLDAPGWIVLTIEALGVDGIEIGTCEKWDYGEGGCDFALRRDDPRLTQLRPYHGQDVTVIITPVEVAHGWEVWVAPGG